LSGLQVRRDRESPLVAADCLFKLAERPEGIAQVAQRIGGFRLERNGFEVSAQGFESLAERGQSVAQIVVRGRVRSIPGERIRDQVDGLRRVASLKRDDARKCQASTWSGSFASAAR
jgi:hypothetical protein